MRQTIEEEGREEAVAACSSEGLPPFWSSLRRDGGHMVMLEGRALVGGLLIYLDLGGGHLCKSVDGNHRSLDPGKKAGKMNIVLLL